ncbi:MAG: phosphoribosylanthranilate isomerase [Acidimicrobiia bacterium]
MTWVKVCGITSPEALVAAQDGGADAVGFVVAPRSPRAVDPADATEMISLSTVPAFIVSVDLEIAEVEDLMKRTGADGIQPHGRHGLDVVSLAGERGWSALLPIPVDAAGPVTGLDTVPSGVLPLFDTAVSGLHGGTGSTFDWSLLADVGRPYVLAGGLGPDNVAEAVAVLHPFGVDASSRLEAAPGVKDPDSIRAFIKEAKSA